MKITRKQNVKLGILIIITIAAFVVAIYYLGRQQNLFKSTVEISAYFDEIKGLKIGNNVRFLGINVGTVSKITILSDTVIKVDMAIEKDVMQYIKIDSKVEIDSDGIMGSKILVVFPGSSRAAAAFEGHILQSRKIPNMEDLVRDARMIIQKGTDVSNNLLEVSDAIKSGEGNLGRLIYDNEMVNNLNEASKNLLVISNDLSLIGNKLNNGEGDLAKLLNSDSITNQMDDIMHVFKNAAENTNKTTENLLYTAEQINYGKGLLHKIIFDTTFSMEIDSTLINVNAGVDSLITASETISSSWILNVFKNKEKKKKNRD